MSSLAFTGAAAAFFLMAGAMAQAPTVASHLEFFLVAEEAGETANKIYKRLNRVRAGLQKCVERQLGLEEATP